MENNQMGNTKFTIGKTQKNTMDFSKIIDNYYEDDIIEYIIENYT